MYFIMDMGTTNTRLWLCREGQIVAERKAPFGAKCGKIEGRDILFSRLKETLNSVLSDSGVSESDVECIIASGMAGSEIGLCDIPHICLPCDVNVLAQNVSPRSINDITSIPFWFVPGVKQMDGERIDDMMRGEETEIAGILEAMRLEGDAVVILPGTHNKIVCVNSDGVICEFYTTFSGELIDTIINHTILAGQVSHAFELDEAALRAGCEFSRKNGLNAALFHVRVMAKNGDSADALSSFLYGAVMGQDVELTQRVAGNGKVYIGGRESLQRVYAVLLGEDKVINLSGDVAAGAVRRGLEKIYTIYKSK